MSGAHRLVAAAALVVAAMTRAHSETLAPADRTRLQAVVETVTAMAAGLVELERDSAAIA